MIQQSVSQQYATVDPNIQIREDLEELKHEYVRLDSGLRVAKWIIGFFIAAFLGSVLTITTKIYSWGYGSATIERRVEYLERELERMRRQ